MRDHTPILLEDFKGYWNRGDVDSCPPDHFTECINQRFLESGFQTRYGVSPANTATTNVLRIYPYFDAGVGDGYLELRTDNKIYHVYGTIGSWTTFTVSAAITNMTDFGFISINGRAYISPSTDGNLGGISGEFIYVYDGGGVNMMRKAAGTAPTLAEGNMTASNSATTGNVEAGIHVFGVVYQTNSGFLTQIGAVTPTVTATGTKKVDLAAIPVFGGGGGTLITKRHIVASKLIATADYNSDPTSYQLFFVPGGEIANNTATTLTVNFFDSELTEDASHLLDLLPELPACGGLGSYHNRMLGWDMASAFQDAADGVSYCMVSYPDEPEAMDSVNGFLFVTREGTGITYCQEYRDVLYVMKFNKVIAFNDNGDVPTSWPFAIVDQGLGCGKHGISTVGIYGGTNIESFILLNLEGIYLFSGSMQTPELSYKIKDYWSTLSALGVITKISAYTDPLHQILFVVLPELSTILIGDYSNGLTANDIKWSKWTFSNAPKTILLWDKDNKLFFGNTVGVHYINSGTTSDIYNGSSAAAIPDPTVIGAMLPNGDDDNINHYAGIRLRISGTGNLQSKLYGMDSGVTNTLLTTALSSSPGKEYFILANMVSQRARVELKTTAINENFKVNRSTLYHKPIFTSYPL